MPHNNATTDSTPQPAKQEPRNLLRLWACVVLGIALWFSPTPAGMSEQAWHVFAVFAATIASFLLRPLPMGVCVLVGILVLAVSGELAPEWRANEWYESSLGDLALKNLPGAISVPVKEKVKESFAKSLSGFANTTTWLVVAAFLLAGMMIRTGLGRRLALLLISRMGGTTLGLGYGVAAAELALGPFVPSNTARGGGVMAPIVNSLAKALEAGQMQESPSPAGGGVRGGGCPPAGSLSHDARHTHKEQAGPGTPAAPSPSPSPDAGEGGKGSSARYLVLTAAHANLVTAAMFLTGMAANPLVSKAAADALNVEFGWGRWLIGGLAPGLVSLALIPILIRWLERPPSAAGAARDEARLELAALGPWTGKQITLAAVLIGMLALWSTAPLQKEWLGYALPTALVALAGVATLVVLGVEKWKDITGNAAAWDTLLWLGGLITMANALRDTGFTKWLANNAGELVIGWPALGAAIALAVLYFYSMYAFSMLTGHILAFAGVLFAVASAAGEGAVGTPPLLMAALVAYFSNLCGCLTNYSTGPVVIYFGLGYVPIGRWFAVGFVVSLVHMAVWLGVGLPYWRLLGWW